MPLAAATRPRCLVIVRGTGVSAQRAFLYCNFVVVCCGIPLLGFYGSAFGFTAIQEGNIRHLERLLDAARERQSSRGPLGPLSECWVSSCTFACWGLR